MKSFILICLLAGFNTANAASVHDFIGVYDSSHWTLSIDNDGSIDTLSAPTEIILTGSNHIDAPDNGVISNTDFTIASLGDGTVTFDWSYKSNDSGQSSFFDPFGYLLNGVFTILTDPRGDHTQADNISFNVMEGDVFGFRQHSIDSKEGLGTTAITGFSAPVSSVPVPPSIWLFVSGMFGLVGMRRKITKPVII
jgi:hypothetical protein